MYYIYIIYSPSADTFYVGYTMDYRKRLTDHNTQEFFATYTSKHRPWFLKAVFECSDNESEAVRIERFIKKQKSRKLLELLIDTSYNPTGTLAQLVRVPDVRD